MFLLDLIDLIVLQIFFYFDINQHQGPTNIPYKISANFSCYGENCKFISFAILVMAAILNPH